MDAKAPAHSPDSGVHEPGPPEDDLEERDLMDLHEDILDENEDNVRQLLREVGEEGLSVVKLCHTELQMEPLAEDHELNRISLSALHRAALLDSNSILTLLLTAHPEVDANLPLKASGYSPLHVASLAGVPAAASYLAFNGAKVDVKDKKGQTPIHLCAQNGHVDIAKVLVVKGGQTGSTDSLQRTPIHYACEEGHLKFVSFLLKKNVECDATDIEGQTPLHRAVIRGQDDIVEALLGANAPVNHRDIHGNTPLHVLLASADSKAGGAPCGDFDYCLDLLLSAPSINIHLCNKEGQAPVHVAAQSGYLLALKQLLARGADINARNHQQETPLFGAKSLEVLQCLLDQEGVNLEAKDMVGERALHAYAEKDTVGSDMMNLLIDNGADVNAANRILETPLFKAGQQGDKDKMQILLDCGAQRDSVDLYGRTILHVVLEKGHCKLAKELLQENNIKINVQNKKGQSPLHLAIEHTSELDLVKMLLQKGGDVNAIDEARQRPADIAIKKESMDTLRFLLQNDAKLSNVNSNSLLVFAHDEDLDIIKWLQNQGMNPGLQDSKERTMLHLAILNGAWNLTLHLIRQGARCDLADVNGDTPLHLAAHHCQRPDIIDELVTNSTSINRRNHLGLTPLHNAALDNHLDIVEILVQLGAKIEAQDKEQCAPLHTCGRAAVESYSKSDDAALESFKEKMEFLLDHIEKGDPEINMVCSRGSTILQYVCQIVDKKLVQRCLQKGALVDKTDNAGMQALHYACCVGDKDIASLLLNHSASVDTVDTKDQTPLFHAVLANSVDTVDVLLAHEADTNVQRLCEENAALHQAIIGNNAAIAEMLIMHDADVNLQNLSGQSALHLAAKQGSRQLIDTILGQDPSLSLKDHCGLQAIHYAVHNQDTSIIKTLIRAGCAVDATDHEGNTPLLLSCKEGSYDHMSILLESHAGVNVQNKDQMSSLHYALQHEETDLLELLVANEADANIQDGKGQTPLLCALADENLDSAQILLDQRVDVHLLDNLGESALHKAVRIHKLPTRLLGNLTRRGCDFHLKNLENQTALQLLKARQDINVEDVLNALDIAE